MSRETVSFMTLNNNRNLPRKISCAQCNDFWDRFLEFSTGFEMVF